MVVIWWIAAFWPSVLNNTYVKMVRFLQIPRLSLEHGIGFSLSHFVTQIYHIDGNISDRERVLSSQNSNQSLPYCKHTPHCFVLWLNNSCEFKVHMTTIHFLSTKAFHNSMSHYMYPKQSANTCYVGGVVRIVKSKFISFL